MPISRFIGPTPARDAVWRCARGSIVSSAAAPASSNWPGYWRGQWANKAELLMVLERPEIPLHTNGSENDIRCQVTRRKISAGTRSNFGRDCRDTFLGLAKTCAKHGVAFWDYLGSRLRVPDQPLIPPLPQLVRCRGQPA